MSKTDTSFKRFRGEVIMRGKVLLALAVVMVGCGNQKPTAQVDGSAGIVNGTEVTAANKYSKHTVFIQTVSERGGGTCTGSIYDSQTILTAAHCLMNARQAVIVFANNVRNSESLSREQVRVVDMVKIYPTFNPGSAGGGSRSRSPDAAPAIPKIPTVEEVAKTLEDNNVVLDDVALLHFAGGLPAGYEPVQLVTSESQAQPGAHLHMIGYGLARVDSKMEIVNGRASFVPVPDGTTTGILRETEVAIGIVSPKTKLILTNGTATGVCSGDSGGPAFVTDSATGKVVQVGIAEAVANAYCNSVSMHTSVLPYLDWIKESAAQLAEQATQNTVMF